MPSRILRGLPALLLLAGSLSVFQAMVPASACACGAPAPVADDPNGDVLIGHEYAVISLQGGSEVVEMRLALETMANESGLIMPTPAPAVVSLADPVVFDDLATQMTPEIVTIYEWWNSNWWGSASGGAAPPGSDARPPVQILDQVRLGPLEATTLAATDADGLSTWLNENGYGVRDVVKPLLASYVDRGWYFVAIKLISDETLEGDLDPIRFTFDTPASGPVYPLLLSQAARVAQTINLYIFDDHERLVRFDNGESVQHWAGGIPHWAGPVTEPGLEKYGSYLTAYTLWFYDPGIEIVGDLVFPEAGSDHPVGQVKYVTVYLELLGIPLGWVLVFTGLVLVVTAVLVIRRVKHSRAPSTAPPAAPA